VRLSHNGDDELEAGRFARQDDCVKMARKVRRLPITKVTHALADERLARGLLPESKLGDALQMAISTAHEMNYLLTWNYAHLCNPVAQAKLEEVCERRQLRAPLLVSPESIPQIRWGQTLQRPDQP
jgi:hypothetical protein